MLPYQSFIITCKNPTFLQYLNAEYLLSLILHFPITFYTLLQNIIIICDSKQTITFISEKKIYNNEEFQDMGQEF